MNCTESSTRTFKALLIEIHGKYLDHDISAKYANQERTNLRWNSEAAHLNILRTKDMYEALGAKENVKLFLAQKLIGNIVHFPGFPVKHSTGACHTPPSSGIVPHTEGRGILERLNDFSLACMTHPPDCISYATE